MIADAVDGLYWQVAIVLGSKVVVSLNNEDIKVKQVPIIWKGWVASTRLSGYRNRILEHVFLHVASSQLQ